MQLPEISKQMWEMDVRIKYGFIRTLHNTLLSVNGRMNWSPEELFSIGMVFRDLQGVENTVFDTVMEQRDNPSQTINEGEEEEEEEEVVEEESQDVN